MSGLRIIIAGGGTGGHIFPAVAIGHALQRLQPGTELLFVGALGKMEMEKVPQEGFKIVGLDIVGFNRSSIIKNVSLPMKLLKSRRAARSIIKEFNPNAVVGVGGFASFPMLNAAQGMGIPTLIQEQNSFAGKSNKFLSKKAKAVCVAYEGMDKFFPADKIMITGNPVRKSISGSVLTREQGQAWLGMNASKTTILVVGGSLGAKSVNEAVGANLQEILQGDVQLVWQTGKPYHEEALREAAMYKGKVKVVEFIREMEYAYAAADIVISRAGALAIAELCIAGKPVIFVPYPHAAEDHQTSNAMALVNNNAALMIKDGNVKMELVKKLKTLLQDADMRNNMSQQLKAMAIKDADERIARKVMEIAV